MMFLQTLTNTKYTIRLLSARHMWNKFRSVLDNNSLWWRRPLHLENCRCQQQSRSSGNGFRATTRLRLSSTKLRVCPEMMQLHRLRGEDVPHPSTRRMHSEVGNILTCDGMSHLRMFEDILAAVVFFQFCPHFVSAWVSPQGHLYGRFCRHI